MRRNIRPSRPEFEPDAPVEDRSAPIVNNRMVDFGPNATPGAVATRYDFSPAEPSRKAEKGLKNDPVGR